MNTSEKHIEPFHQTGLFIFGKTPDEVIIEKRIRHC